MGVSIGSGVAFGIGPPGSVGAGITPPVLRTLWSWGAGAFGTLGNNSTSQFSSPVQVGSSGLWTQLSCGYFTAGLQAPGTLWTWGYNVYGQLGNNSTNNLSSPTQVGASSTWTQVACGYGHMLIIQSSGTLWACGYNNNGQLGINTAGPSQSRSSTVQVGALTTWTQIACGYYHNMAIQSSGTLWAWGYNAYGQLGTGDLTNRSSPTQVGSLSNWIQISCGYDHTMAIKNDSTLWACGYNNFGQLGLNTNAVNRASTFVQVGAGNSWAQVAAGRTTTAAIQSNGTLWTWGQNNFGRLGLNTSTTYKLGPTQVGTLSIWSKISNQAVAYQMAGIQTNGTLWMWGNGGSGQLGNNDTSNQSSPIQVGALNTWTQAVVGKSFTVGLYS